MAKPIAKRVFLTYSGDAIYLKFFIDELQRQFENSLTTERSPDYRVDRCKSTAKVKVELNIPGLSIERETEPVIES